MHGQEEVHLPAGHLVLVPHVPVEPLLAALSEPDDCLTENTPQTGVHAAWWLGSDWTSWGGQG